MKFNFFGAFTVLLLISALTANGQQPGKPMPAPARPK